MKHQNLPIPRLRPQFGGVHVCSDWHLGPGTSAVESQTIRPYFVRRGNYYHCVLLVVHTGLPQARSLLPLLPHPPPQGGRLANTRASFVGMNAHSGVLW